MTYNDILPLHVELTEATDEFLFQCLRQWRNRQLAASDWTQLPDVTLSNEKVEAWKQYRQELRDMLKQNDDPKLIVFPEPPK
jgi:hypothetical protein